MTEKEKGPADNVRTFIAIDIPQTIKDRIEALQRKLGGSRAQVSWTKASKIHLTLKFLGDVARSKLDEVIAAAERAASRAAPFEVEVGGAGCFPSLRNPRVLWIGLSQIPDPLAKLHTAVELELARIGFAREQKKFSPHLTIARIRTPSPDARELAERLIEEGFQAESFRAEEVIVMRSEMKSTGSVYTPQAVIKLGQETVR
jgi:RNA 2',3'-cyclic 3'-phosphodiesterase